MSNDFNWENLVELIFIAIVLISFLFSMLNYFRTDHTSITEEKTMGKEAGSESGFASIIQKSGKNSSAVPPPTIPG